MPRKILALACVVVGLHIIEALTLGTSTLGSFLANGLQIFACGLAVAMAFGVCRRGRGLSRPFWLILGAGVALWGVANLGWMYYEVVLHSEPPSTSVVRFLFGLENVLLAMVLFLDQDKDSPRIDAETALDFIQIGIVFFFIYVEFYYLPARPLGGFLAFLRDMRVENAEDAVLTVLAAIQAMRARKPQTRKLYGSLARYLLFLTVCAGLGISQFQESKSANAVQTHKLAMDSAINGMAILDAAGKYIYVNPAYARMIVNADPEVVLGKSWREISTARDADPVEQDIRRS